MLSNSQAYRSSHSQSSAENTGWECRQCRCLQLMNWFLWGSTWVCVSVSEDDLVGQTHRGGNHPLTWPALWRHTYAMWHRAAPKPLLRSFWPYNYKSACGMMSAALQADCNLGHTNDASMMHCTGVLPTMRVGYVLATTDMEHRCYCDLQLSGKSDHG